MERRNLMQRKSICYVLAAGILWGCMGLFVRRLNAFGLFAMDVVQLRITPAALFIGLYLLLFNRKAFHIRLKDLWCFLGTGIVALLLFTLCYFSGMQVTSLSVMGVLLYTAPIFVTLISAALFRERLTVRKLVALAMCVAGCCLVSGIGAGEPVSTRGILLGLGSGFFYALYSVFSRFAINRGYGSWTITFYTFLFCALGDAFLSDWPLLASTLRLQPVVIIWGLTMALFTAFVPYVLYTRGLEGMESSKASMIASVEPVVATIVGAAVFREPITALHAVGIALVVGGIVVLSLKDRKKAAQ